MKATCPTAHKIIPRRLNRRGMVLLLSLVVMMILFTLGTAYLTAVISETGIARNHEHGEAAFYYAESGLNRGLQHMAEHPDPLALPWTVTEHLRDGYYVVTVSQAEDFGTGYVRVSSTGYRGRARRRTEIIILLDAWTKALMSDTDINFEEAVNAYIDGDVHANSSVNRAGVNEGLDYVAGSRPAVMGTLRFEIRNNTGASRTLSALTAVWTDPVAYYETISMRVIDGTNYGTVFNYQQAGNIRVASGQTALFNQGKTVIVPAGSRLQIDVENFRANPSGGGGATRNVNNTLFTITNWAGGSGYQTQVPVAGQSAGIVITGLITEGSQGDPLIPMPQVVLERFYEQRTFYHDGDYIFNGINGQADRYNNQTFYITGIVTLDSNFKNLNFNLCALAALGGVRIGPQRNGVVDYILDSRLGRQRDISFSAENKTATARTINAMSLDWDGSSGRRCQQITIRIAGGMNYGTVWTGNAAKNTRLNFTSAVVIPAHTALDVSVRFSQSTDASLLTTFYQNTIPYTSTVVKEGNIPNLVFRGRNDYSAIATKTGDIIEYGTKVKLDMVMQGIIYSEQGIVEFQNLTLEGAILGRVINLKNDVDIRYRPRYVPNPPPEFISGYSTVRWQESF